MKKLIRVDMSKKEVKIQEVPSVYKNLGGRSFTSQITADEVPPTCHPLGPNNKLTITIGMFAGTSFPCSGRLSIGGKSPLTWGVKESNVGGTASWKLARIGVKAIIIEGLPNYNHNLYLLRLAKDKSELIPTDGFSKMGTYQLVSELRKQYGENIGVIANGPAGELMLSAAGIGVTDTEGNPCDYAGRGGMGAVLGSKKIKAIIIDDKNGSEKKIPIHDKKRFSGIAKEITKQLLHLKKAMTDYGTAIEILISNKLRYLPTENYRFGEFVGAAKISGEAMYSIIKERGGKNAKPCMHGCPIRCSNTYNDGMGRYLTSSLEYETIALLGSNLGIDDLDIIAEMDRLCDDFGLDTMEIGAAIGVAMEAGLLSFGDSKKAIELIREVVKGTPFGRIIGNGVEVTGKIFAVRRTPSVKGQGLAAYDPRGNKGMGVTYMSSTMGADHTAGCVIPGRTGFDSSKAYSLLMPDGLEELSLDLQVMAAIFDHMGICFFVGLEPQTIRKLVDLYNAGYGTKITFEDLVEMGRNVLRVEKSFNEKAGIVPVHHLPEFLENEPLPPHNTVFDVSFDTISKAHEKYL